MGNRELAGLACKIVSIYIMMQGINMAASILTFYHATFIQDFDFINIIYALIYIFTGILLWIFSNKLSSIMVREEKKVSGSEITIDSIQRVAFSVLGLYFIGISLPRLVAVFAQTSSLLGGYESVLVLLLNSLSVVTQFVIGLLIFFGSTGLVNFMNSMRTPELKRDDNRDY